MGDEVAPVGPVARCCGALLAVVGIAALLVGCSSRSSPTDSALRSASGAPPTSAPSSAVQASSASPQPAPAGPAQVRVAVAGLWRSPDAARAVDSAAVRNPVDVRAWLAAMTLAQRKDLEGRLDSQLLLGDAVTVLAVRGDWAQVTVADQASPLDRRGYPGWVPLAQLTFDPAPSSDLDATVVAPTAWLFDPAGHPIMETSAGTRLRVRESGPTWVVVASPDGAALRFQAADVSVTPRGVPALSATSADVVRVAQMFQGLPYLWAGTTGFGFDCSGLTFLDYRLHGIALPRDADAQATAGAPIARDAVRAGDLLFFARRGVVHHVAMSVAADRMIQSPEAGRTVEVVPVSSKPYAAEYQGARGYLG